VETEKEWRKGEERRIHNVAKDNSLICQGYMVTHWSSTSKEVTPFLELGFFCLLACGRRESVAPL